MDFTILIILQGIVIIIVALLLWRHLKDQSNSDTSQLAENIASKVLITSAQSQQKLFSDLSETLNKFNKEQQLELLRNQAVTDQKFAEIQLRNQEQLSTIKDSIQTNLNSSLQQILNTTKEELISVQKLTKSQLDIITQTNQDRLTQLQSEIERKMNENLQQNLRSFENVTKNLTEMQSTANKMIDSTKSIDRLNSIFERTSSKAFGDFGEKYLESMLDQHLSPQSWQRQVSFPGSQDRIDFVITVGDKRIGIDCKFPVTKYEDYINAKNEDKKSAYQAFLSAVKLMAQDISTKYYKPNSLDALFLYFPSDGMFAEVVSSPIMVEALQKVKVTPSSPSTLFPLIILIREYQFKQKVNENAEEIIKGLSIIKKNVLSFRDEFRKLGDKLRQAQQNFESADKSLQTVQNKVDRLEHTAEENENEISESVLDTEELL